MLVASWFNRQSKYLVNGFSTNRSTTSTTPAEINSEIRGNFLTWGDAFNVSYAGYSSNSAGSANYNTYIGLDGASTLIAGTSIIPTTGSFNNNTAIPSSYATGSVGQHYVTLCGSTTSSDTATWGSSLSALSCQLFL